MIERGGRQKGYATILTLVLFVVMALSAFSMYDVGQVSAERIRLQNTADATVHSAAALLARDANFTAYTNRAMIANQAAIGQLVGLVSWVDYLEREAINLDNLATFISWIPGIGQAIKNVTMMVRQIATQAREVIDVVAQAGIAAMEPYLDALSESQLVYHDLAYFGAINSVTEIIRRNDPNIDFGITETAASLAAFQAAWGSHVRKNKPQLGAGRDDDRVNRARFQEKTALVMKSRDRFTADRNDVWLDQGSSVVKAEIRKYGGTEFELVEQQGSLKWNWTSMDTESLWLGLYKGPLRGWEWEEALPIGWGAAHALAQGSEYDYADDRWNGVWNNSFAATLAVYQDGNNNVERINGLREYIDFHEDNDPNFNGAMIGKTSKAPGLTLYLAKSVENIRTRKTIMESMPNNTTGARLDVEEKGGLANNRIVALAKSEAYFARPPNLWRRSDGRIEHGNMYNPYWQVRLTEPDRNERLKAALVSGTGLAR